MKACFAIAVLVLGLQGRVEAQSAATSLGELTRRADGIVVARVVAAPHAGALETTIRLRASVWIVGAGPDWIELSEPAGRACGRALRGLAIGAGYVVFLRRTPRGPALLATDARAIVGLTPGIVEHVRALRATDGSRRIALLAAALEHADPRVRDDAALDLSTTPGLETAAPGTGAAVVRALARAVANRGPSTSALLVAAARTGDAATLDVVVPVFLQRRAPALDRAIQAAVARFGARDIVVRVAATPDPTRGQRTLALASALEPTAATALQLSVAANGAPEPRAQAIAALLDNGATPELLVRLGAHQQSVRAVSGAGGAARTSTARFRSIDPSRVR